MSWLLKSRMSERSMRGRRDRPEVGAGSRFLHAFDAVHGALPAAQSAALEALYAVCALFISDVRGEHQRGHHHRGDHRHAGERRMGEAAHLHDVDEALRQ